MMGAFDDDFGHTTREGTGYKRAQYHNLRKDGLSHEEAMDEVKNDNW
jgi:hypothetical protein